MKYVIDTSFAQSLVNKLDSNHRLSLNVLLQIDPESKFVFPLISYIELLCGAENFEDIDELIKTLTDGDLEVNNKSDSLFVKTIDLKKRKSLKANDCLILAICKREKARLLTFDKKLLKIHENIKASS